MFKAGEGSGRSGSFFFLSHNKKFLIKTLRGDEKNVLLAMLDSYISHIEQTKGYSLLTRIYGLFTFKTKGLDPIDLILMQNSSKFFSKSQKVLEFDIKGSLKNRKT